MLLLPRSMVCLDSRVSLKDPDMTRYFSDNAGRPSISKFRIQTLMWLLMLSYFCSSPAYSSRVGRLQISL